MNKESQKMAFPKRERLLSSKLETINESSPLVVSENNNNADARCEFGNSHRYYPKKDMFDRTFTYTMCLGTLIVLAMLGLVLLAEAYGGKGRHSFSPFYPDVVNGSDNDSTSINVHVLPI